MKPVRILIVDDLMAPRIAEMLRSRFDPRWLSESVAEFVVLGKWDHSTTQRCDIAVIDVRNEKDEDVGTIHAIGYAKEHPDSLVIIKSAHDVFGESVMEALSATPNIRQATGSEWDAKLLRHVMEWLREARTSRSVHTRFAHHDCAVSTEARHRFAEASKLIDVDWFERATQDGFRKSQVALLEILGDHLSAEANLGTVDGRSAYLRVCVAEPTAWMPWEYVLFGKRLSLRTPLLYWLPVAGENRAKWRLRRVLFVYEEATKSSEAELQAIKKALSPLVADGGTVVDAMDMATFVSADNLTHADVVHFAMHGPDTPTATAGPAMMGARRSLLRSISATSPTVVVLNACNGIYMLLNQNRQRYPVQSAPLRALFDSGVDTVVTTHFLLDDSEMPPTWSRTFYLALALTGDAAVAAGVARHEVAQVMQTLCELATVVVARQGSCLTRPA